MSDGPSGRALPRELLQLAVIGASAAGLLQLVAHMVGRFALGRAWSYDPRMVWLAPAANLMLFLPLVAMVWLLGAVVQRRSAHRGDLVLTLAIAVVSGVAFVSPLLLLRPKLHLVAIGVLAAGIAGVVGRWSVAHRPACRRSLRWATAAALLIPVGGEVVVRALERKRADVALASAAPDQPDVLFLVLDTVRALSMSVYGYARETTPNLARLAREGARFDHAVATAPWTLASHASLFTGLYPNETSVGWTTPLDGRPPVLAERLAARGFATSGFVANLTYCTPSFGLARGFQEYQDYLVSFGEASHASSLTRFVDEEWHRWRGDENLHGRPTARDVTARFLTWQGSAKRAGRPYFAFLNLFDAHAPYAPPAPYDTMYLGRLPHVRDPDDLGDRPRAASVRELQAAYDQSLTYVDAEVGRVLDSLRARGVLDRTVVVVVADHGEEFFEKGIFEHGDDLYFPSLHVPLLVRYPPRVPAGTVVDAPVSLRDVAATTLDLARSARQVASGGVMQPSDVLPGSSLTRYWSAPQGGGAPPEHSALLSTVPFAPNLPASRPVSRGAMRSLVHGGMHFIVRGDGHEELYDIMRDPFEVNDVSADREQSVMMELMRNEIGGTAPRTP